MTKKEIRHIFKKKRAALSDAQIEKSDDLILVQFQKIPLHGLNYVHSYMASERLKEPDTSLILKYIEFRFPHITVVVPKTDSETMRMEHYQVNDDVRFAKNFLGIDEPVAGQRVRTADLDLVLVPLLAFDERGYRVGFGKGYYDRFLAECRPDTIKIGLSFFGPVDTIEDADCFDISLDYCCTPYKLYSW